MTMESEPESGLTPRRINEIRQRNNLAGAALLVYLDLPDDVAEQLFEDPKDDFVLVCDRSLSLALLALIRDHPGIAEGIDDEAARALRLFIDLGPDRQAVLASLVEAAFWSKPGLDKPDLFAGENLEATWRWNIGRYGLEEAQRIRAEAEAATRAVEGTEAAFDANDVLDAVANIVRFPRAE